METNTNKKQFSALYKQEMSTVTPDEACVENLIAAMNAAEADMTETTDTPKRSRKFWRGWSIGRKAVFAGFGFATTLAGTAAALLVFMYVSPFEQLSASGGSDLLMMDASTGYEDHSNAQRDSANEETLADFPPCEGIEDSADASTDVVRTTVIIEELCYGITQTMTDWLMKIVWY